MANGTGIPNQNMYHRDGRLRKHPRHLFYSLLVDDDDEKEADGEVDDDAEKEVDEEGEDDADNKVDGERDDHTKKKINGETEDGPEIFKIKVESENSELEEGEIRE